MNKQRHDREMWGNERHRRSTLSTFMCCFPKLKAERRKLFKKKKSLLMIKKTTIDTFLIHFLCCWLHLWKPLLQEMKIMSLGEWWEGLGTLGKILSLLRGKGSSAPALNVSRVHPLSPSQVCCNELPASVDCVSPYIIYSYLCTMYSHLLQLSLMM